MRGWGKPFTVKVLMKTNYMEPSFWLSLKNFNNKFDQVINKNIHQIIQTMDYVQVINKN